MKNKLHRVIFCFAFFFFLFFSFGRSILVKSVEASYKVAAGPIGGVSAATGSSSGSGDTTDGIGVIKMKIPDLGQLVLDLYIVALFAAGLFFFVQLAVGGISWIAAGGEEKALESARGRITNAIIGLVIVVAAAGISIIVTSILGINIFRPGGVSITPPTT